jgi:glycosyltransferase involved in cell wall biosynthesis
LEWALVWVINVSFESMTVTIGVQVHAEPGRLRSTLDALSLMPTATRPATVLLLPDGPDDATRSALGGLDLPCSATADPAGPPACFNRLAATTDTDVVILLESGALPAPGAIEQLVAAVLVEGVGLAGPSTNSAWSMQGVFPGRTGHAADVASTGAAAARRYGAQTRSMAPLYGLADFCFAVRREVIEAIGGADEGYGLGPCWEMEYCARAARAGFDTRWVCGAYVYRPPFTARRRLEEARRFEASRRRYQDSLCALKLRRESAGYEPHCRGDACEHFAPRELIELRRPLPQAARAVELPRAAAPVVAGPPAAPAEPAPAADRGSKTSSPTSVALPGPATPLVSCIMPTRNRADFALHAIDLFQRQDYEHRELLVLDDGDDDLAARMPDDPRVRYLRAPAGESIGAKRNRACAEARGAFVAQWDDDDWYGPGRLSAQLAPLLTGSAEITALANPLFFELDKWRFWSITPALHRRLFVGDVHGGTLVFARHVWEQLARYPALSLAEEAALLTRAQRRGARLRRLDGTGLFVYLRHAGNAWRFDCGEYLDPRGWRRAAEPALPPADRAFYAARSHGSPPAPVPPLVTAIMPTADRRQHVARSLAYFARQDHPSCELLVLDDGDDRVADLMPHDPRVRYVALDERLVLGEKRNRACELARGEIIVHWDDDDWQSPHRISYQVAQLERHGASLCGPRRVLYFDPLARRAWLYEYPAVRRSWLAGNGLCYRRSLWERNRFPHVAVGEDTRFVWSPQAHAQVALEDHRFLAGLVHASNTSRKLTSAANWQPRSLGEVQALLGDDWADYTSVPT